MRSWIFFVLGATLWVGIAGCGGSNGTDDGSGFPAEAGAGVDSSFPGVPEDASFGGDATKPGLCQPRTCAQQAANCGPAGDGCGGILQCGSCTGPETCGGGGTPSQCGGASGCVPRTCAQSGATCGPIGDGCGGVVQCGSCTAPATCGGGGTPSACGGNSGCVPKTCTQLGKDCGPAADGCGGVLNCGSCSSPATCGGGGAPSKCGGGTSTLPDGGPIDAGAACVPRTCAQLGATCGQQGDGCGGVLGCGTCTAPQTCGGGGTANKCGGTSACVPKTCTQVGKNCGPVADGCGNVLQCGACASPTFCGGGGTASVCGGVNTCTPRTCAQQGANCGPVADGCGGLLANCGTCTAPAFCGGGGPNVCGAGQVQTDAGVYVTCDGGGVTSISGTVLAGTDSTKGFGNPDPVYNAVVYIPSGAVQPITTGATCDKCSAPQSAVVSAVTGVDGKFTLVNAPVGASVPVVIQLGKWRRVISVNVTACQDNALTASQTHLPRNKAEGNIPRFAMSTGDVDALECVLRKMGIDDAEFTNPVLSGNDPTGAGRVHVYEGVDATNGKGGAIIDNATPREDKLWGAAGTLDAYDVVLLACRGGRDEEPAAAKQRLVDYADLGGRVFATHFSYVWLYNNVPFSQTATWNLGAGSWDSPPFTGYIDTSFPKGSALSQWLQLVGASTTAGRIPVSVVRHDFDAVVSPAQRWMYSQAPDPATIPLHYTFNTPVAATPANQCGRVVFSDFHVENTTNANGKKFPAECGAAAPLTPQEKLLEFMLFDLSSCISQDTPTCTPRTCAQAGATCGPIGDGCGGVLQCGTCVAPQTCGGGGTPNQCGGGCTPITCAQQGLSCGAAGDGCGGVLQCGTCVAPQTCGGGGTPGQCGAPTCTPRTCASQGIQCGPAGDGCGNLLQCGACVSPLSCGGGGQPGICGANDAGKCAVISCATQGISCGPAGDGCGGLLQCGTCTPPQTCGGGGQPGVCGAPTCTPRTCAQANASCGPIADGCGGVVDCGVCVAPQTCGGGGTPNQCGAPNCTPRTCAQAGANCGPVADGCGAIINCGECTAPQTCGGTGVPSVCGGGGPR
jgi:hypothetical protein